MYKGECLNPQLSRIIKEIGHTDILCVCDAGFPIPKAVERVDLAWKKDEPAWLDVCRLINDEMVIEKIILAEDIKTVKNEKLAEIKKMFHDCSIEFVPHEKLKETSHYCRAIVRTGEYSPFCNIIFVAGVSF